MEETKGDLATVLMFLDDVGIPTDNIERLKKGDKSVLPYRVWRKDGSLYSRSEFSMAGNYVMTEFYDEFGIKSSRTSTRKWGSKFLYTYESEKLTSIFHDREGFIYRAHGVDRRKEFGIEIE